MVESSVIDEILSVEDHAQNIVKEAQDKSREMILQAQSDADKSVRDAVAAEKEKNRAELEQAEQDARTDVENYTASLEESGTLPPGQVDKIAGEVVDLVCRTPLFGESAKA